MSTPPLGDQSYWALYFHMEEALIEKNYNSDHARRDPIFALFSKKYYNEINNLNHDKKYDFCFIGSINSNYKARIWVIEFAKRYFTENSIFINTDNNPHWESLGVFDYSHTNVGYCPKLQPNSQTREAQYRVVSENIDYFEKMCQSIFVLCPAGDAPWSFRFYEVLMCKSLPIVESIHHTYRTRHESMLKYKHVLYDSICMVIPYNEYIKDNIQIFENNHLLT
jgi:hypothetical protein